MAICKDCLHEKACVGLLEAMGYRVCTDYKENSTRCVNYTPKSQYAEAKHGEWQECGQCNHVHYRYRNPDKWKKYKCSECGYGNGRYYKANYCPNCGAKMDGGERE